MLDRVVLLIDQFMSPPIHSSPHSIFYYFISELLINKFTVRIANNYQSVLLDPLKMLERKHLRIPIYNDIIIQNQNSQLPSHIKFIILITLSTTSKRKFIYPLQPISSDRESFSAGRNEHEILAPLLLSVLKGVRAGQNEVGADESAGWVVGGSVSEDGDYHADGGELVADVVLIEIVDGDGHHAGLARERIWYIFWGAGSIRGNQKVRGRGLGSNFSCNYVSDFIGLNIAESVEFADPWDKCVSIDGHCWYLGGLSAGGVGDVAALVGEDGGQLFGGDLTALEQTQVLYGVESVL